MMKTEKRKYTMSRKAVVQRRKAANSRVALVKEWDTTKISRSNLEYCKKRFGTVNEALNTLREMEGGR